MKNFILIIILMIFLVGCSKDSEEEIIPKAEVSFNFNVRTSPFGKSSARSASEYNDVLSSISVAIIDVINLSNSDGTFRIRRKNFNNLADLTMSLSLGHNYRIEITYKAHRHDEGLSFNASSGDIFITDPMNPINMNCWTDESLVLLDKEGITSWHIPKFSDGTIMIEPKIPIAWMMFESPNFWFIYIQDTVNTYYFQYGDAGGKLVNLKINKKLKPGDFYLISEVESGLTPVIEYDSLLQGDIRVIN